MLKLRIYGKYIQYSMALSLLVIFACTAVYYYLAQKHSAELFNKLTSQYRQTYHTGIVQQASEASGYLSAASQQPLEHNSPQQLTVLVSSLLKSTPIEQIVVFDSQGKVFVAGNHRSALVANTQQEREALQHTLGLKTFYKEFNQNSFIYATPIIVDKKLAGSVYLVYSMQGLNNKLGHIAEILALTYDEKQKRLIVAIICVIFIVSVVSALGSALVARTISAPIHRLIEYTKRVANTNFAAAHHLPDQKRKDEFGELARAFSHMSVELDIKSQKVAFQAFHDPLTNLPNRNQFIQHVEHRIANAPEKSFSVLFMDLDNFKSINDNYGHDKGDRFLRRLAKCLCRTLDTGHAITACSRQQDSAMIARVGGDEFLICLPYEQESDQRPILQSLLDAVSSPQQIDEDELFASASMGVAQYPQAGRSADELIKHADIAMYRAKDGGKNSYRMFTVEMEQDVNRRSLIECELRKALHDLSQFELHFQPLVNLEQNKLVGAEALVRWQHPDLGTIYPDDFIPVAEATGIIVPMGNNLIEQACRQIRDWKTLTGQKFHISINLSAMQIYRQDIAQIISSALNKYQVEPEYLHVEITESLLLKDEQQARKTLDKLREAGIKVWLDDFGTGYSSLAYLRRFQLDGIKIDRSFIRDIPTVRHDEQLVKAIIALAHSLNLDLVAEGIEKQEHFNYLRDQHCELGQGYYFSKPIPAALFEQKLLQPYLT